MTSFQTPFQQKLYEARKAVLEAERKKRETDEPTPQEKAEAALLALLKKLQQPLYVASHQETPFGEVRSECSEGLTLSATKLKKLPTYRQLVAEAAALCPHFDVRITTFAAKLRGKTARVWQVVVTHPGLTRKQYFGARDTFSPYEHSLADAFDRARAERLKNLRHDRAYVATFNRQIADWIPTVEQQLVRWYALTGKAQVELTFGQPWYIPYEPERLKRLPAYAALEAAMRALDRRLRVSATGRSAGMGNSDLVITVSLQRMSRGV